MLRTSWCADSEFRGGAGAACEYQGGPRTAPAKETAALPEEVKMPTPALSSIDGQSAAGGSADPEQSFDRAEQVLDARVQQSELAVQVSWDSGPL